MTNADLADQIRILSQHINVMPGPEFQQRLEIITAEIKKMTDRHFGNIPTNPQVIHIPTTGLSFRNSLRVQIAKECFKSNNIYGFLLWIAEFIEGQPDIKEGTKTPKWVRDIFKDDVTG